MNNKLQSLKAKRAQLYKELQAVREQISTEQFRLEKERWNMVERPQDIANFLEASTKFTKDTISDYPCNTVYLAYVKWSKHYYNTTPNKFTNEMKALGFSQKTIRKSTSVYRVYCIKSS